MDSCLTIRVAGRKKLVVRGDLIIRIYWRLAKKRYLRGKHTYEYERIYVPIPSRLHDIVRPFLNQRLKNTIHSESNICARANLVRVYKALAIYLRLHLGSFFHLITKSRISFLSTNLMNADLKSSLATTTGIAATYKSEPISPYTSM